MVLTEVHMVLTIYGGLRVLRKLTWRLIRLTPCLISVTWRYRELTPYNLNKAFLQIHGQRDQVKKNGHSLRPPSGRRTRTPPVNWMRGAECRNRVGY